MARRLRSEDFDYVVTAVTVQRQVGGALAGLLDLVADTVRGAPAVPAQGAEPDRDGTDVGPDPDRAALRRSRAH